MTSVRVICINLLFGFWANRADEQMFEMQKFCTKMSTTKFCGILKHINSKKKKKVGKIRSVSAYYRRVLSVQCVQCCATYKEIKQSVNRNLSGYSASYLLPGLPGLPNKLRYAHTKHNKSEIKLYLRMNVSSNDNSSRNSHTKKNGLSGGNDAKYYLCAKEAKIWREKTQSHTENIRIFFFYILPIHFKTKIFSASDTPKKKQNNEQPEN